MKKTNYLITGILAIAIIVLFILQFAGKKQDDKEKVIFSEDSVSVHLPIAYVDADSLLPNFNFYTHLMNDFEIKLSKQKGQLDSRLQAFQKEVLEFQQKAQNNAFLTRERMEQEQIRLSRKQEELERSAAQIEQELAQEKNRIDRQWSDTLSTGIKEFNNNPKKYQLIFTKGNILYADESYNITQEVIEYLNAHYKVE
jgi:outer membrane protein